jgi:hypothetical protein
MHCPSLLMLQTDIIAAAAVTFIAFEIAQHLQLHLRLLKTAGTTLTL